MASLRGRWRAQSAFPRICMTRGIHLENCPMPILKVTMVQGATAEEKMALFQNLSAAVQRAVQAPAGNIRIILNEIPPANWWHATQQPLIHSGDASSPHSFTTSSKKQ